jgi:hypothetical protein
VSARMAATSDQVSFALGLASPRRATVRIVAEWEARAQCGHPWPFERRLTGARQLWPSGQRHENSRSLPAVRSPGRGPLAWAPRQIAAERPRWAYSVVADA